jgi:serine/threonine-protein kinase PpkA
MKIPGYDIRARIGEGGMATAYLAVQKSLGRQVVLKVLDTAHIESKHEVERFLNEGRIVATLRHPHIITVYDIGMNEDYVFMSMEYIEGGDLKSRIANSIFTPAQALDLIAKVASALEVAHQAGIIHRDVKPGNILFRKDGTPLLSDFGIAKQLTLDHDLTHTGIFLGSPNYMAPEQADAGPIDGRVDIYALGVILYEMLTGMKPYRSESIVDVILQHKQAPIPKLPEGLEAYQPLLELMMAKNRKDRFRDCASLVHYMRKLAASGAVKTAEQMTAAPDLDITGEHRLPELVPALHPVERVAVRQRVHWALLLGLVGSASGFGLVMLTDSRMNTEPDPLAAVQVQTAPPAPVWSVVPMAEPAPGHGGSEPGAEEVARALAWLGQKSLEDYRLTAPEQDNAHYYFSRLLQFDPASEVARRGLLQVAERFAQLAERELANDNLAQARDYINIGLQLDPANQTLHALQGLSQPPRGGFVRTLRGLFGSG